MQRIRNRTESSQQVLGSRMSLAFFMENGARNVTIIG